MVHLGVKDQGLQEYLRDNERFADLVNGTICREADYRSVLFERSTKEKTGFMPIADYWQQYT